MMMTGMFLAVTIFMMMILVKVNILVKRRTRNKFSFLKVRQDKSNKFDNGGNGGDDGDYNFTI